MSFGSRGAFSCMKWSIRHAWLTPTRIVLGTNEHGHALAAVVHYDLDGILPTTNMLLKTFLLYRGRSENKASLRQWTTRRRLTVYFFFTIVSQPTDLASYRSRRWRFPSSTEQDRERSSGKPHTPETLPGEVPNNYNTDLALAN